MPFSVTSTGKIGRYLCYLGSNDLLNKNLHASKELARRYKATDVFQRHFLLCLKQRQFLAKLKVFSLCTKTILPCSNAPLGQGPGGAKAAASVASRSRCSSWSLIRVFYLLSTWKKMNPESLPRNQFCSLAMESAHFLKSPQCNARVLQVKERLSSQFILETEKEESELDLLVIFSLPPKLLDKSEIKYLNSLKLLKNRKDCFLIFRLLLSQK